ncbi:hypothetical protein PHISCL_10441, partial [Aspergillus sclerotialis]
LHVPPSRCLHPFAPLPTPQTPVLDPLRGSRGGRATLQHPPSSPFRACSGRYPPPPRSCPIRQLVNLAANWRGAPAPQRPPNDECPSTAKSLRQLAREHPVPAPSPSPARPSPSRLAACPRGLAPHQLPPPTGEPRPRPAPVGAHHPPGAPLPAPPGTPG